MIPVLLFLLAIAAVYVGMVETAFSALMRLSLRLMAERGGRDDRLGFYLDDPIRLFLPARFLLGIIFSLATMFIAILTGRTGFRSIGMLLLFVAVFILLCEHVLPLLIVRRNPERMLEVLLPPFDIAARFLHPLTGGLVRLMDDRRRESQVTANGAVAGEESGEVAHAYLEAGEEQGLIERDERRLLQSIVDFGDALVREVMTPRPDIVAIREDATLDELRALFREQEYSRIPVYRENLDNIIGVIFVKDLIQLPDRLITAGAPSEDRAVRLQPDHPARVQPDLAFLVRPATFVPETKRVPEMLKEFQRKQTQIAIVVDEYGGTAGLVTIEDLLEEIVGEIRDEYDVETEPVIDEGNGSFIFSAKVNIDEVRERLGVDIEAEGFETVGGYVLTRVGRVPAVGETFEMDGMTVEVLEAERRRIHKVRFRRAVETAAESR
jgi:CBS domain containing-hemolysin-like protein